MTDSVAKMLHYTSNLRKCGVSVSSFTEACTLTMGLQILILEVINMKNKYYKGSRGVNWYSKMYFMFDILK